MRSPVSLGLDVGGTASRWVACDASGAIVARGEAGGASGRVFDPIESERLSAAVHRVATELAERGLAARRVVAGITGFGPSVDGAVRAILGQALGLSPGDVTPLDDMALAYLEHFSPGEGHLVSAGTGSFGLHIAADGARVRVGGRGILIDDAGSGAWIALRALDRIFRAHDRHGAFPPDDVLANELLAAIGGRDWEDVRGFVYTGERGRIGTLAIAVARAATRGDAEAVTILRAAGTELARLALALAARVGNRPVAVVGRVLDLHVVLREQLATDLAGHSVLMPRSDTALAAARVSLDALSPLLRGARH